MDDLNNKDILENYIYPNINENYYWSDDYSAEFYIKAAKCGFITTSMYTDDGKFILLPEIQYEYAILNFEDIKIEKKVKKLLEKKEFTFTINEKFDEVLNKIEQYHKNSWLNKDYIKIIKYIKSHEVDYNFKFITAELCENDTKMTVSGELGYKIGNSYTSLTGFTTRTKKFNNWGKLQLVLLNNYLKENGYKLWNLGHPQLKYKLDLGAKVYSRKQFLKLFQEAI